MLPSASTLSPDQERALLHSLFTSNLSLPDLAQSLNLPLLDLLELVSTPAIQSKLVALEQAAPHALRLRATIPPTHVLDILTAPLHTPARDLAHLESAPPTLPEGESRRFAAVRASCSPSAPPLESPAAHQRTPARTELRRTAA